MGKSLPSTTRIHELVKIISSDKLLKPQRRANPNPKPNPPPHFRVPANVNKSEKNRVIPERYGSMAVQNRMPLSVVVADCAKRWFHETLNEAKAGNSSMQLLVGQMYYTGYGVTQNPLKGRFWIHKASARRDPAWKVFDKQPGYGVSDSDSEEVKDATNNLKE